MRFRRSLALSAVLAGAVVLTPATAAPFSDHLDTFVQRIEEFATNLDPEDPTFKQQKKIAKKVQKKLRKKSASLATDAALAGKLGALIAKGGPEFEQLAAEIASAMESIGDNVNNLVESIQFRADELPEGKLRDKAQRSLTKIRAELAKAEAEGADLKTVGKALKKALLERRKAVKFVKKAEKQLEEVF